MNDALPPEDVSFDPEESTRKVCSTFNFSFHAICHLGVTEALDSRSLILSNFVPEAIEFLDESGWWDKFEAVGDSIRSGMPVRWSIEPPGRKVTAEQRRRFSALLTTHLVDECLTVPVHCGSRLGVTYLVGNRLRLTANDIQSIQIAMFGIFQRLCEIRPIRDLRVTRREIECLDWTSRGHTSQDVASILSISEHTVVRHLAAATQKLDAANRGQAVAKAIRLGLID